MQMKHFGELKEMIITDAPCSCKRDIDGHSIDKNQIADFLKGLEAVMEKQSVHNSLKRRIFNIAVSFAQNFMNKNKLDCIELVHLAYNQVDEYHYLYVCKQLTFEDDRLAVKQYIDKVNWEKINRINELKSGSRNRLGYVDPRPPYQQNLLKGIFPIYCHLPTDPRLIELVSIVKPRKIHHDSQ